VRTLWYLAIYFGRHDLPAAIAAAESWISAGGCDPRRFSWQSRPVSGGYELRATCPEALAR
jgi:hypothetical protein